MLPTTRNKAIQCYGYLRLKQATLKSAKKCLTRLLADIL